MTANERARRAGTMGCAWELFRRDRSQGFGSALSRAWEMARELQKLERERVYAARGQRT